jgi:UDP-N-acetylmuramoyl-L-alanyl-D-glutamate--2,6-diaminopimelate ligase
MGAVAATAADVVVLTADNSRHERTEDIIQSIRTGFDGADGRSATRLVVDPDRRSAIRAALADARAGDVVVVAGKGHESTQTVGERVHPFDDREVARQELRRLAATGGSVR